ncbi:uncharacterized protein LOC124373567, partial [Homalodisca vitripennis]|uniref:uncharacterized protein LOC124373567 n=1 Tax=Homalodisca vitripennis TaxID=197043 RepID=UPI001EEC9D77
SQGHSGAWPWLQELMGQTHLTTVNNKGGVEFLVSVFVLCVDIMSGYSSLETVGQDSRAPRLPQAVVSLVNQHGRCQVDVGMAEPHEGKLSHFHHNICLSSRWLQGICPL